MPSCRNQALRAHYRPWQPGVVGHILAEVASLISHHDHVVFPSLGEQGHVGLGCAPLVVIERPGLLLDDLVAEAFGGTLERLGIGLILGNIIKFPKWFDTSLRTEYYIKTGIVLLGATLPFTLIVWAGPVAIVQAVEMARKTGRILVFGGLPKDRSKPGVDMNTVHYNVLVMIGTTTFAPRHQRIGLRLLASGRIPGDRLITHRFPLSEFKQAAAMAMEAARALVAVSACPNSSCRSRASFLRVWSWIVIRRFFSFCSS